MKFKAYVRRDDKWLYAGEWESKQEDAVRQAVAEEWDVQVENVSVEEVPRERSDEPTFWRMTQDGPKSNIALYGTRHGRQNPTDD